MRHSSLSGSWSGAYRYSGGAETVFNAQIEETGGAFTGAIQEPNTFLHSPHAVLHASVDGVRTGRNVSFVKFYDHSEVRHSIRYEGSAEENLTRVDGRWTIDVSASGSFFMTRDELGEAAEAEEAVQDAVNMRR